MNIIKAMMEASYSSYISEKLPGYSIDILATKL